MRARDIMTSPVITAELDTPVQDIARLLYEHGISAVPVLGSDGAMAGIVSEGDLIRRPELKTERKPSWWLKLFGEEPAEYVRSHGLRAADVMTRRVVSVGEDTPVSEIAELLERHRIKRVPVLRGQRPVGVVSRANLVRALAMLAPHVPEQPADARELREAVVRNIEAAGQSASLLNVIVEGERVQVWGAVDSDAAREAVRVAVEQVVPPDRVELHMGTLPPSMWSGA